MTLMTSMTFLLLNMRARARTHAHTHTHTHTHTHRERERERERERNDRWDAINFLCKSEPLYCANIFRIFYFWSNFFLIVSNYVLCNLL